MSRDFNIYNKKYVYIVLGCDDVEMYAQTRPWMFD